MFGRWLALVAAAGVLWSACTRDDPESDRRAETPTTGSATSSPDSPDLPEAEARRRALEDAIAAAVASGFDRARVALADRCLDVEIADSATERGRGLMGRDAIGDADGMLFVWDHDVDTGFFMYETRIPLTIGWYRADGSPLDRADMEPCPERDPEDCPVYRARGRYRYALEVAAGTLGTGALGACG
jgi:uncharacterized membrane protein (UPF0127 family)